MTNTRTASRIGGGRRHFVEAYGLRRDLTFMKTEDMEFIAPWSNPYEDPKFLDEENWVHGWVYARTNGKTQLLNAYAYSKAFNVYITMLINLTDGEKIGARRYTAMRHRDMIIDNILDAGGDLKKLQYFGVHCIVNETTQKQVAELFGVAKMSLDKPGIIELTPDTAGFAKEILRNPFTRGVLGLLREYEKETGNAKIKRVIFVSLGMIPLAADPVVNIAIELCRPGDAEHYG